MILDPFLCDALFQGDSEAAAAMLPTHMKRADINARSFRAPNPPPLALSRTLSHSLALSRMSLTYALKYALTHALTQV